MRPERPAAAPATGTGATAASAPRRSAPAARPPSDRDGRNSPAAIPRYRRDARRRGALPGTAALRRRTASAARRRGSEARTGPSSRTTARRPSRGAASQASSAKGAISARPKAKPPCRLAHSAISGRSQGEGARARSRARNRRSHHSASAGRARMCGRASRPGAMRLALSAATTRSAIPERSRAARFAMTNAARPAAAPVSSVTPPHPAARKASARRSSASHSCAVHGAPAKAKEKGSARGTAPCWRIHSPVARCVQVSPSLSTAGEKAASANIASAISSGAGSAAREAAPAAFAGPEAEGSAIDIGAAWQRRDNVGLRNGGALSRMAANAVPPNGSPRAKFPANREKNREFIEFRPYGRKSRS